MIGAISRFAARVRTPSPELHVPIGVPLSRLDLLAQARSVAAAEAAFARAGGAIGITRALGRFLGDAVAAELTLKKALVVTLEERMRLLALRADPPERYGFDPLRDRYPAHALDLLAAAALGEGTARTAPAGARTVLLLHVLLRMGDLLGRAVAPLMRARAHNAPATAAFAFLANIRDNSIPVFAAAAHQRMAADVWLIADRGAVLDQRTDTDLPRIAADRAPVYAVAWLRDTFGPALQLSLSVLTAAARRTRDPVTLQLAADALRYARDALAQRRLLAAFRPGVVFDVEEHSARHIVRASELRRVGCRLVRWPQSQLDEPGASLAYIGYDMFLASGPYVAKTYGGTWHPACRPIAVGTMRNDRAFWREDRIAPEVKAAVAAARARGDQVLAFFGISPGAANHERLLRMTEAVLAAVQSHPGWFLVIKPKGAEDYALLRQAFGPGSSLAALEAAGRAFVAPYVQQGLDPCPAGWLIGQMDMAAAVGSVQIEALVRGKPAIGYRSIFHETVMTRALVRAGMLHAELDGFAAALGRALDDPARLDVPFAWFREMLDPFADADAFDRIMRAVYPDQSRACPEAA